MFGDPMGLHGLGHNYYMKFKKIHIRCDIIDRYIRDIIKKGESI